MVDSNAWSQAQSRLTHVTISQAAARAATGAPGGELVIEPGPHVGASYQVVLPSGRVVHEGGLTLHAADGVRLLPAYLADAAQALLEHAQQAVAEHEGLGPA